MKKSLQFFITYYFKKHIGTFFGHKIGPADYFWKNYYRFAKTREIELINNEGDKISVKSIIDNHPFKASIRTGASSDILVFRQVFGTNEYWDLLKEIEKRNDTNNIKLVIDAGANVGYTSILLKLYLPNATIVSIEPDIANAAMTKVNMAINNFDKTEVIIAGVWSHDCWLELKKDKSDGKEWGFYVVESNIPTDLKAIDILNLPQLTNFPQIDILKLDIEGSEQKLFEDRSKISRLLQRTKYLAIEIHDDMADRKQIYSVLKDNGYTWFESGEITIATNLNLVTISDNK
jgi:FkbM family methyltransferase